MHQMLQFRAQEFANGVADSCRVWQSFQSSRTLRTIAKSMLPLHGTTIVLGLWFHSIDYYGLSPEDWLKHAVLWTMWSVLWGAPVYVLGSLLQIRYANLIQQAATAHQQAAFTEERRKNFSSAVAETLYGALLNLTFLFQIWLINFLGGMLLPDFAAPTLKWVFSIFNVAWATSFAAFESRLITKNQDLFQRVLFVEQKWAYALGYGIITSVLYHMAPSAISNGLWQYAVLLLMLNAMRLKLLTLPGPPVEERPVSRSSMWHQLRVFYVAQIFAVYVIQMLNDFVRAFSDVTAKKDE